MEQRRRCASPLAIRRLRGNLGRIIVLDAGMPRMGSTSRHSGNADGCDRHARILLSPAGFTYLRTTPSVTDPARQGRLLRMTNKDKSTATWSDVKAKLGEFDRAGLLGLVQDLYVSSKDNRNFLHARFRLGGDVLEPYKTIIERWLRPDLHRHQEYSVAKAKRRIADYKKASGLPEGIAELTVYYCEQAIRFSKEVGLDDGAYHDALVRMFEQAPKAVMALPKARRLSWLN
jgi:hypothetical protein